MNFKINFWTLLFLITAGALIYGCFFKPAPNDRDKILPGLGTDYVIDTTSFQTWYKQYREEYLRFVVDSLPYLKDSIGVHTMEVKYFEMNAEELKQIYEHQTNPFVHARIFIIPVIKEGKNNTIDTLDLVFHIADINPQFDHSRFYDFTNPCPPLCRDSVINKLY